MTLWLGEALLEHILSVRNGRDKTLNSGAIFVSKIAFNGGNNSKPPPPNISTHEKIMLSTKSC
jgi:hypothetical protein